MNYSPVRLNMRAMRSVTNPGILMRLFYACILFCAVAVTSHAADPLTKSIQQKLKEGGFFYGEPDGVAGSETAAALKRYQIRQGLAVTGEADLATVQALGVAGNPAFTEKKGPPLVRDAYSPDRGGGGPTYSVPRSGPDPGVSGQAYGTAPAYRSSYSPAPVSVDPRAGGVSVGLARLLARTPYDAAPISVQQEILTRAQHILRREGFYDGNVDGQPGPRTSAAIAQFQRAERLPYTGQLDMPTLAEMGLLPQEVPPPPSSPYYRGGWGGVWGR